MMRLTLVVVGDALLGVELEGRADALGDALTEVLEYVYQRTSNPLMLPPAVPTSRNLRFRRALAVLDRFAQDLIGGHGISIGGRHDDLTATLAESGLPAGRVRDHILTFLVAGNETTANALTWAWYLLTQNPEAAERLEHEVDRALDGRNPGADDLPALDYARRIIEEAMRLYPPVWATVRDAVEADETGGTRFRPARPSSFASTSRTGTGSSGPSPNASTPNASSLRTRPGGLGTRISRSSAVPTYASGRNSP
jgi:cytochrome P450